ncbi:hypothetical protein vBCbaSRXM_62 [Citromicrobium phage vB_CbaS-RXM]|nr:hypothetical protein vBCbaSRXM_62 [Citromicrobium phage vB_CbaS-RXM]
MNAKTATETRDYLAIILVGAGSSYARGPDKEDVVKRVMKIVFSDWKSLFDLKGQTVSVNLYDVTGHDDVYWEARGVFAAPDHTPIERLELRNERFPG